MSQATGPTPPSSRLVALDALRGFALLGIALVNAPSFFLPLTEIGASHTSGPDRLWALAVRALCETKFIALFALMFGAGFGLQTGRDREDERAIWCRRMLILGAIGSAHGLFVWFGDILLIYAALGLVIYPGCRLGVRDLTVIGSVMIGFYLLVTIPLRVLVDVEQTYPPRATQAATVAELTLAGQLDPSDPRYRAAETRAYREGPYDEACLLRALSVLWLWVIGIFGLQFLRILGLFLLGAAMIRGPALRRGPEGDAMRARLRLWLPCGLLACVGEAVLLQFGGSGLLVRLLRAALFEVGSLALAAGLVGLVASAGAREHPLPLIGWLSTVGRCALTVYLGQSLVFGYVSYHWGLGQFDRWSWAAITGLAAASYVGLGLFASVWLRVFRFGPLEWVWRSLTYGRPAPLWVEARAS